MIKKILIVISLSLMVVLFVGCGQQEVQVPQQTDKAVEEEKEDVKPAPVETIEEIEETGEESVDDVGTGISSIADADQDLEADELDDLDDVLSDIENI